MSAEIKTKMLTKSGKNLFEKEWPRKSQQTTPYEKGTGSLSRVDRRTSFMKKRIIIVHGWGGSPIADWIGWAAEVFREKGYEVIAPEMPDTDAPAIEKWMERLRFVVGIVDENTYFIGHSIGCQSVMRFLETSDAIVGGAIFVAGWFDLTNQDEEEKMIAKPWLETPID